MFIVGNLLGAIAHILHIAIAACTWLIIIRALISWVNPDPYNSIVQFLLKTTEPLLAPIRQRLGMYSIGLDLSPLIVILLLIFCDRFLIKTLFDLSLRMGG